MHLTKATRKLKDIMFMNDQDAIRAVAFICRQITNEESVFLYTMDERDDRLAEHAEVHGVTVFGCPLAVVATDHARSGGRHGIYILDILSFDAFMRPDRYDEETFERIKDFIFEAMHDRWELKSFKLASGQSVRRSPLRPQQERRSRLKAVQTALLEARPQAPEEPEQELD